MLETGRTVRRRARRVVPVQHRATSTEPPYHNEPARGIEGKFGLEFCLAAAVVDRAVGIDTFTEAKVRDPAIRALMPRVRLYPHRDAERAGYGGARILLDLRLADGRAFHREPDGAIGSPHRLMSRQALEAKFRDCAARVLPPDRIVRAVGLLWDVERLQDVRGLVAALAP